MARVSQVEKANQEGRLGGGGGGEGQHLVGCQQGRGPVQEAGSCQGQSWVGSVCLVVGGGRSLWTHARSPMGGVGQQSEWSGFWVVWHHHCPL